MSEFDWIDRYLKPIATSPDAMGLENDVGLLRIQADSPATIATLDTLVEGVHFFKSDPPETLSKKLLRVNVSDILCKGARPCQALMSIAVPAWFSEQHFQRFCKGFGEDLSFWGVDLIGGDLVSTPGPLVISLALTGIAENGPVLRSGARAGDAIYATGLVGAGLCGYEDAKAGTLSRYADHFRVPDLPGLALADLVLRFASASIDISDGLIAEARHISHASNVSLQIELGHVPWPERDPPLERMLALATGGDDYQTLLTVSDAAIEEFEAAAASANVGMARIGTVLQGQEVALFLHGDPVELPGFSGYRHQK
ncbi:MAG: thiamine-phosphate kinase [Henriciella sp.]|uniref:thiamine-phosphate kinase n=1 Tax=Henriciella sp. TaxID=1968823 RepID=UPI0032F04A2F